MFANHTSDGENLSKARSAWGSELPEWVALLAGHCDQSNQREVGAKLDRSSGYVSRLINRSYAGSYEEAEQLVRSVLGGDEVLCPVWNDRIPLTSCRRNRRRKGTPRTQLHHAYARTCPTCPMNTDREGDGS